jgi:Glucose inhibited division protein A
VSGTACAAALAAAGARVVLVNSSLDVVGLPGYGPAVRLLDGCGQPSGAGSWEDLAAAFARLPREVAAAWLADARVPLDDTAMVVVDRRRVSLRVKWALENLSGVELRQGLVVAVDASVAVDAPGPVSLAKGRIRVTTAFGEEFWAVACVLAPGMSLGGRVLMGEQSLPGGRYGEVPADALAECLQRAGVALAPAAVAVGAHVRPPRDEQADGSPALSHLGVPLVSLERSSVAALFSGLLSPASEPGLVAGHHEEGIAAMREWERRLPGPAEGRVGERAVRERTLLDDRRAAPPEVLPEGIATGEWYAAPGAAIAALLEAGWTLTRPPHQVEAQILATAAPAVGFDPTRLPPPRPWAAEGAVAKLPRVWVCGQAAGARGYVQSFVGGVVAAQSVMAELGSVTGPEPGASTAAEAPR